ncbi:unnamed protein product [Moneuplotes crassus]|uniref:Uncharacterized protein n=1 Tax=Euplotes crassus TaxID=5936 RepID=A0AAD1U4S5_EUPCR|nr:unnamed protein product [Moneuplotes crassus]
MIVKLSSLIRNTSDSILACSKISQISISRMLHDGDVICIKRLFLRTNVCTPALKMLY